MEWQDVQNSMSLVADMPILTTPAKIIPATKTRDRRTIDFLCAILHHLFLLPTSYSAAVVYYNALCTLTGCARGSLYSSGYEMRKKCAGMSLSSPASFPPAAEIISFFYYMQQDGK
jgi:hypothetical protein